MIVCTLQYLLKVATKSILHDVLCALDGLDRMIGSSGLLLVVFTGQSMLVWGQ